MVTWMPVWSLMFVLLLDFHERLRVVWSMFIPGALHGIEASFLADTSLRKLHNVHFQVVWCRRQPLANVGAGGEIARWASGL